MPTFVQEAETAWNTFTNPLTTPSFSALAGDWLIVVGMCSAEDHTIALSDSVGLSWTLELTTAGGSRPLIKFWSTLLVSDVTGMTVTFTHGGAGTFNWGGTAITFRDTDGPGTTGSADGGAGTSACSMAFTPSQDNSMILVAVGDGAGVDGSGRVWRTGAGALTEMTYAQTSFWGVYMGYHEDAGVVASKTLGLTTPNMGWSIAALEFLPPTVSVVPEQTDIIKFSNRR